MLEELWYGNVTPGERSMEKGGRRWHLGRLMPLLSEKAKEVLDGGDKWGKIEE